MTFATKLLVSSATFAVGLAIGASASAQTCTADKDCPPSFTCVQIGVVSEPTPACPPNTDCAQPVKALPSTPVYACQPKACAVDADCSAGMICHAETSTECSGGSAVPPCAPGADCPTPTTKDPVCTTVQGPSACAFKWQLPCNADADCGDGFACQPSVIGSCSGSGGGSASSGGSNGSGSAGSGSAGSSGQVPAADAGTAPGSGQELPPPDMCTTMAVYPGSCRPKATSCIADADCPAAWKCLDAPVPIAEPATGGTQSGSAVDGGAATKSASSNNSGAATSPPTVAPAVKTCESPYDLGIRNGTTKGDGPIGTPGASAPATDNGTSGGGPTMGTPPSGSTQGSGSGSTTSPSAGGCSINPGTDASHFGGLALLTLLGLIAVRRLRRS